jgi:preprotein translocase subunit SecB
MKAALIDLTNYFVTELQFNANHGFDVQKPPQTGVDDLQVTPALSPNSEDLRNWQITLRIGLNAPLERNSPYSFLVEIIGFVRASPLVKEEDIERLMRINGTSLVFSAAREIIRAITSRGPFKPILLPTVTFWEAKPPPPPPEPLLPPAEVAPEITTSEEAQTSAPVE